MDAGYEVCAHVTEYKTREEALCTYEILHACFVACITKDALKIKDKFVKCKEQGCGIKGRIHACLSCKYFGCHKFKHIHNHSAKENHALSMDTNYGIVFCFECNDYQYDRDFEKIAREQISNPVCPRDLSINKWMPSIEQINLLREHNIVDIADIELRGMTNMGNTCYINCILQSLIHAPVFRNYFLSTKHKCEPRTEPYVFNHNVVKNPPSCFVCEVADIVQECFSGKTESFSATSFLLLLWMKASDFRGYSMQDAFLFYLKLIESLHSSLQGTPSRDLFCQCDIDVIFSGSYESVYTCACGYFSTSLHNFKVLHFNDRPELKLGSNVVTFKDCLEKNLQSIVNGYDCKECGEKSTSNCEIILQNLPLICCFQINISADAFSMTKKKNSSNKKGNSDNTKKEYSDATKKENPDTTNKGLIVKFEEYFDMSPYKFSRKKRTEKGVNLESNPLNFFYLFAVVQYKGEDDSGHYVCYVRRNRDKWFKCDDHEITAISREKVKEINPYLLFYQRPVDEYSKALLSRAAK